MNSKHSHKRSVRIVTAIVVGFLIAGAGTKSTYSCVPIDGAAGCTTFEKAIMHPSDLAKNKQNSLTRFTEALLITAGSTFILLSILAFLQ